jgi:hypothetical protein
MSRHPDRQIQSDLALNVSFNRGDASDRSMFGHVPTLNNGASVSGRVLVVDGTNDFLSYPDNAAFSFTNGAGTDLPFSASAWIYPTSVATAYRCAIAKGAASNYEWSLYAQINRTGNNGPAVFVYNQTASTWIGRHVSANPLSVNTWHHLAATYSGSEASTGLKVYLNGAQVDNTTWNLGSYTGATNGTSPVRVGSFDGASHYFPGNMDDVRIYRRELTAAEVGAIYASGRD